MIIWINGAFGSGKTTYAFELHRRLPGSYVFDPEKTGYFIRKSIPRELREPDFQDHEEWRAFTFALLQKIYREFSGTVIVPMTVINPQYCREIIGRLTDTGASLRHYIVYAEKETIRKRLNKRCALGEAWARSRIDRCIYAFDHEINGERIVTDNRSISSVAEEIAAKSGLNLAEDKRSRLKKYIDRTITSIRHINIS